MDREQTVRSRFLLTKYDPYVIICITDLYKNLIKGVFKWL